MSDVETARTLLDRAAESENETNPLARQWVCKESGHWTCDYEYLTLEVVTHSHGGSDPYYQWSVTPKDRTQHMAKVIHSATEALAVTKACAYGWHTAKDAYSPSPFSTLDASIDHIDLVHDDGSTTRLVRSWGDGRWMVSAPSPESEEFLAAHPGAEALR